MELRGLDVGATSVIGVVVDGGGRVLRHARRDGAARARREAVRVERRGPATLAASGLAADVALVGVAIGAASLALGACRP